jgi:hypothetical protein
VALSPFPGVECLSRFVPASSCESGICGLRVKATRHPFAASGAVAVAETIEPGLN